MYNLYAGSIEHHLAREVKKRGLERLHWDASYKEAKLLARYQGKSLFKALITGTNELGEIRVQFHVVTDGQDQFEQPLEELIKTLNAYGQRLPDLFFTDQPSVDKQFFLRMIPSLREFQDKLSGLDLSVCVDETPHAAPELESMTLCSSTTQIETAVNSLRNLLLTKSPDRRVLALDAEWDTTKGANGQVTASSKVSLIQIGYFEANEPRALLLRVGRSTKLPNALLALFREKSIIVIGRAVAGDLAKIGTDFLCKELTSKVNSLDLDKMAKARGAIGGRQNTLARIAQVVCGINMDKNPAVRASKWSAAKLSKEQQIYSALDVIVPLRIYTVLSAMPDLTQRLTVAEAVPDVVVDAVPSSGSVVTLATRAASARILPTGSLLRLPSGIEVKSRRHRRGQPVQLVLEVQEVFAPSFVVKSLRRGKQIVTLKP